MGDVAGVGARDRLHVLRPLPPGLERALSNGMAGELHHLCLALPLERADLVGRVEVFDFSGCHKGLLDWILTLDRPYTRHQAETTAPHRCRVRTRGMSMSTQSPDAAVSPAT